MQDLQSYQYYDPSPQPAPVPWWQRKRTWQLVALFAISAVVLTFAIIAALNVLKNRKLANQDADLMSQAAAIESQLGAECDEGDTACLERARADAARNLGLIEACQELEDDAKADCVSLIAIDERNPELCNGLSGAAKDSCSDTPYLLKAQADMDLDLCGKIVTVSVRAGCYSQVQSAIVAAGKCQEAGLDQALCDTQKALADAIASNDPAACTPLNESDEYICLKMQSQADADSDGLVANDEIAFGTSEGVPDTDADGLSDGDEVHVYLTDPTKADTDGDGFSDKTEIDGGYDPLK